MFRTALLDYWQGKCCVTGLDVPELLRASHIRPWAQCETDEQRLDVFNGLLLAPHLDALFDGGWITFGADGRVIRSPSLSVDAAARLAFDAGWVVAGKKPGHEDYLRHHRWHVFRAGV